MANTTVKISSFNLETLRIRLVEAKATAHNAAQGSCCNPECNYPTLQVISNGSITVYLCPSCWTGSKSRGRIPLTHQGVTLKSKAPCSQPHAKATMAGIKELSTGKVEPLCPECRDARYGTGSSATAKRVLSADELADFLR